MPKYSKRESKAWTLSSTVVGWGLTGVAICLVAFFGIGVYFGYGWGYQEGKKVAVGKKGEFSSKQLAKLTEGDTDFESSEPDKPELTDKISSEQKNEAAISEKELGFLQDEPETKTESKETAQKSKKKTPPPEIAESKAGKAEKSEKKETAEDVLPTPETGKETSTEATETKTAEQTEAGETDLDAEQTGVVYVIQASSSKKKESAQNYANELEEKGYPAVVTKARVEGETWYRVRVGEFPTKDQARKFAEEMVNNGDIGKGYWVSTVTQ